MKRYENKGSLLINKLWSQYRTTADFFPLPYLPFFDEEKLFLQIQVQYLVYFNTKYTDKFTVIYDVLHMYVLDKPIN